MIDQTELTEAEKLTLKTIALERRKEKIEKEIEEMKKSKNNDKADTIALLSKYFQD